ncbi:hypothetical protein Pint_02378 [Pistacia integerrima]|uniref:Uncharacterized protein n=1 Tax=Pistacia integerrima TaxID=434235 RepID=A0ACC0ZEQ1_9ROSI|nr:hypothetical protein Pint_02378 [Pistacia integerrima]
MKPFVNFQLLHQSPSHLLFLTSLPLSPVKQLREDWREKAPNPFLQGELIQPNTIAGSKHFIYYSIQALFSSIY